MQDNFVRHRQSFNPRPHTAGDSVCRWACRLLYVSIHARTRRATSLGRSGFFSARVSIHARTRRATRAGCMVCKASVFQSTPAHGGRRRIDTVAAARQCFNPRPHTAGDVLAYRAPVGPLLFQSTPAHGGRHFWCSITASRCAVSIHARTRRATSSSQISRLPPVVSIHARTRRATSFGLSS